MAQQQAQRAIQLARNGWHVLVSTGGRVVGRRTAGMLVLAALGLMFSPFVVDSAVGADKQTAKGVVFHDANNNLKLDANEERLANIRVSNGVEIVKTDDQGRYQLPVDDDTTLFVIKPSGWRTPLNRNHLPRFYYIHKPAGSPKLQYAGVAPTGPLPESVDFPLYRQEEPKKFEALLFGDPQPRDQKEIDYIAHDVVEELLDSKAAFGVTLGDIMFNNLSLFESGAQSIAMIGIPWYNVIGNHDINFDAKNDRQSDETFERNFGPAYYSFDYGPVHFLVVDDVEWVFPEDAKKGSYHGGLGPDQLQFIRNDLDAIPKDQMVVLMMHIPLVDVKDRHDLYRLIEQRPFCISISGHTHHHEHRFIKAEDGWRGPKPHHHIVNVTVCGSWWSGTPDERGIPHTTMADGAPNGYSIIKFDGSKYQLDFKAAGRSPKYQMNVIAPEAVSASQAAETEVYVNVFNGSEKSTVHLRVGQAGTWTEMQQVNEIDPLFEAVVAKEAAIKSQMTSAKWLNLPKPKNSTHLWKAKLPADVATGVQTLFIKTVDMHGRTYHAGRQIRITGAGKPEEAGQVGN